MDIFYNTQELTLAQKIALIKDCMAICFNWWADKLDCSVSLARQRIDFTFDEIMEKFNNDAHFVVVDRKFHMTFEKKHFEIVFRTMTGISYFLWIQVEDEKMQVIIEKYNLKPMGRNL